MTHKIIIILILFGFFANAKAQQTTVYTSPQNKFNKAVDLYDKEKFTAAQEQFGIYISDHKSQDASMLMHAYYYQAMCAKELYHDNSEFLFKNFVRNFPESPRIQSVYFNLGIIYYRKKRWKDAKDWFIKVEVFELSKEELAEYYFKLGYSHFMMDDHMAASKDFREIIKEPSQFQNPAIYYYAHIAYEDNNYQTALEWFDQLKHKKGFNKIVPYYITQIYFAQEKYQEVVNYGGPLLDSVKPQKQGEIANMVGDSYYRLKKYDEAIPYLEKHANEVATTVGEKYRLAFSYYMSAQYDLAAKKFAVVSRNEDKLGQNALYYMGHSYIELDQKEYARNAYQDASKYDFNPEIKEDALFRFAQLAYDLSLNPYDEAIEAFQSFLAQYPKSPRVDDAYQYLVNVYMTTKNYTAAIASLEKVDKSDVRLQRAYQMVLFNRGVELYSNKSYDDAINHFKKVKDYPVDQNISAESLFWLGEAYYQKEKWNESRLYFNKFIKAPGVFGTDLFGVAHYNIAYTYLKDNDYIKAIDEFRQYADRPDKDDARLTDAYLRIADAYYMKKEVDDVQAIKYYGKALDLNLKEQDYAHFQRGMSFGYLKKYNQKATELKKILMSYSGSKYAIPAKYHIGEAYRLLNDYEQSINYYIMVSEQHPNNQLATKALLHLGYLYMETGKLAESIDSYTAVLQNDPNKTDCREAVYGLKDVYVKKDQLEKWEKTVNQYGCVDGDKFTLDSTFYAESVNKFILEDNCEKLKVNVDRYLKSYPKGYYKTDALYAKAECLFKEDLIDESMVYYLQILDGPKNEYSEIAYMRSANAFYKADKFKKAQDYFSNLEKLASNAERLLVSRIGQMRCYYKLEDYLKAKSYANLVLKDDQTPEQIKVQAQLILGMSAFKLEEWDKALDELIKVNQMTTSISGAEAKYYVALIYFKKQAYKTVEEQVLALIQQKPSYNYWLAKGYLLLSDNFLAQNDYFQAKHTLQSILDNYTGDDEIKTEAFEKLKAIEELEKSEEEGRENRSMELDLGGDEDVIKDREDKNNSIEEGGQNE